MNALSGILFLAAGIALFVFGVLYLAARERSQRAPKRTVEHFQRSRGAMHKLYRAQVAIREAARARARASHPTARHKRRRSA